MNRIEITRKIKVVLENYGLESKQLTPDASFINDLGFDSLEFAELILTAEHIFDTSIPFENGNIHTINDLVDTIENLLNTNLLINQKQ